MIKDVTRMSTKLFTNKVFQSSAFLSLVSVFGGGLSFLLNILVIRQIGETEYGIIYPLNSFIMVVSLIATAIQLVMTSDMSRLVHEGSDNKAQAYFRHLTGRVLVLCLILSAGLLITLPLLKELFHIRETTPFLLVFAIIVMNLLLAPLNSAAQSRERFNILGANVILFSLVKFGSGLLLIILTGRYFGMLYGILTATVLSALYLAWEWWQWKSRITGSVKLFPDPILKDSRLLRIFIGTLFSVGAYQLITYLDSILVRRFIPDLAGTYSTVNLLGKASFYIAMSVSSVLLPLMARDKKNAHKSNSRGLLILLVLLVLYAAALAVFSPFISQVLLGGRSPGMEKVLPLYGFMFIPYAAITFLVNYYIVHNRIFYPVVILAGTAVQAAGIALFHGNLIQVSLCVGISGYLVLILLALDSLWWHPQTSKETGYNSGGTSA